MLHFFLLSSVIVFFFCIKYFRIEKVVKEIIENTHAAIRTMSQDELSEDEKEEKIQAAAKKMLLASMFAILRIAATFVIPLGVVTVGAATGTWYTMDEALQVAASWEFILTATVATIGALVIFR